MNFKRIYVGIVEPRGDTRTGPVIKSASINLPGFYFNG